jgi:hypothetical protein
MPEPVQYRKKGTQSGTGMLRYQTEIQDAGMPMPAASTSLPMPSYWYFIKDYELGSKHILQAQSSLCCNRGRREANPV